MENFDYGAKYFEGYFNNYYKLSYIEIKFIFKMYNGRNTPYN